MSEMINNTEKRQEALKQIIKKLHDGVSPEAVRAEFEALTIGVTAIEITAMEQALVDEGMPVEEIQRLCDVHASVFKGSIEDIHANDGKGMAMLSPWHPLNKLKLENRGLETLLDQKVLPALNQFVLAANTDTANELKDRLTAVLSLDRHYSKKENLLFPFMEKHNITAPPQVMWGVDDDIRGKLKALIAMLSAGSLSPDAAKPLVEDFVTQTKEMIFKEEEIMMPMVLEKFSHDEWLAIEAGCMEIGFTFTDSVGPMFPWIPTENDLLAAAVTVPQQDQSAATLSPASDLRIPFDAGSLLPEEINAILNTLPLDMTFVGADDRVKYFTQGKERIFDRPITIIGREVKNCHPPKSVHIVEQIVADLRSGKKDHEDFWIKMGSKFVYIRYFAVRNAAGDFLGTLEITQDIKPIQDLEGEKRLMS